MLVILCPYMTQYLREAIQKNSKDLGKAPLKVVKILSPTTYHIITVLFLRKG